MTHSEVLTDILELLDEFEKNRKADYSIWGYLYQFDLMFFDMLTDRKEKDLFNDYDNIKNEVDIITYEAEMVEDYCKKFISNNKEYIRLAQIKYNARSKSNFYKENKDALKTLYYMYLKSKVLDCELFDFKCSLFYYNENENNNNETNFSKEIKEELKSIIDKELEHLDKKLNDEENDINVDKCVAASLDSEIIYNSLESKNLAGRIQYLFYNIHSEAYLNDFVDNILIVKKVPERQSLIRDIKDILEKNYSYLRSDNYSLSRDINKGDLLYSLGINFIINEWQSKADKNDRKPINLEDIKNYIISTNNRDISIDDIVENLLIEYFNELSDQVVNMIYEVEDENIDVNEMMDNLERLLKDLLVYFTRILKKKSNRYSFFNTISNNKFKTKEEYLQNSVIEEYGIINQMKDLFISFCLRTLKIMYWEKYINNNEIDLNTWFKVDDDLFIFKKNDLKIKAILLPNVDNDRVKYICREIVQRINKIDYTYSKPRLWYFKEIGESKGYSCRVPYKLQEKELRKGKMHYSLDITKIPNENSKNNIVGYDDDYFYIECMDCLKMNDISNYEYIKYIFSERCVKCKYAKNR
ncbi:hypothetical protein [Romboutsia timonensis]|uniref:hypothetical protein n=1 Tax=Romboutsia timonensis TaxID=1776391 RepID=UPI00399B5F31